MDKPYKVTITKSDSDIKKMKAVFFNKEGDKIKSVQFGAKGYDDYTMHHDVKRKDAYILRHGANENWRKPMMAGTLSRYILWNKIDLDESIIDYKNRFDLK